MALQANGLKLCQVPGAGVFRANRCCLWPELFQEMHVCLLVNLCYGLMAEFHAFLFFFFLLVLYVCWRREECRASALCVFFSWQAFTRFLLRAARVDAVQALGEGMAKVKPK